MTQLNMFYILIYRSMLQWNAWQSSDFKRHSAFHFDTHKIKSLQSQFVIHGHEDFPSQLEFGSKQCPFHSLNSLKVQQRTCYHCISILRKKYSFQDHTLPSPICHPHSPHSSLANIVNLWCNWNHIKLIKVLTY